MQELQSIVLENMLFFFFSHAKGMQTTDRQNGIASGSFVSYAISATPSVHKHLYRAEALGLKAELRLYDDTSLRKGVYQRQTMNAEMLPQ